jgi:hypothetical protein
MGVIDRTLWDNRHADPRAIEAEFRGDKGRGWLMRWLPSRAHDNGMFLIFSNGVGVDDDEIRTGNAMIGSMAGYSPRRGRPGRDGHRRSRPGPPGRRDGPQVDPGQAACAYTPLTVPTGCERDTRALKFEE